MQWKKGTVLLKPGNRYEMKQNGSELHLQIHKLKGQDSGVYKCCAARMETTASVAVKGTFMCIPFLPNFNFCLKHYLEFKASIVAFPIFSHQKLHLKLKTSLKPHQE